MAEVPADQRNIVRRNLRYMESVALPILNGGEAAPDEEFWP